MSRVLPVMIAGGLLCCWQPCARSAEFFFDDFESYVTDDDLRDVGGWEVVEVNTPVENAAWTVTNPGGRLTPPTENGLPATGIFLISDSDAAGGEDLTGSGMSHDVTTPSFSTAGAAVVWLHVDMSAQLNNNGVVVVDIDVTTDDGATWANVFRRVGPARPVEPLPTLDNADGFFGRLHVDLSAAAANKPNVRIRFRQFEPEDDWWVAIDNIQVDDQPQSGAAINLINEKFANGIPNDWQVRSDANPPNEAAPSAWSTSDLCLRSLFNFNGGRFPDGLDGRRLHHLRTAFAIVDATCGSGTEKNEYLITPALDLTAATAVFLHYKSNILNEGGGLHEVLISFDGGDTFELEPLFSYDLGALYDPGEDPFYAERVLAVPAAIGKSPVAFAFHYQQGPGEGWWALDDVKVSVAGTGFSLRNCANREFEVGKFDLASGSVTMTWKSIAGDEGFRIFANGTKVGNDLPAGTTSFTDSAPPPGQTVVQYSLQSLKGGAVEFECAGEPISVVSCPRDMTCCVNQATKAVNLSWFNGANIAGTGYRLLRNGLPVRTVPLATSSFADTVPAAGVYEYQLLLNGGNPDQCPGLPLRCTAVVLGADLLLYDDFDCYRNDTELFAAGWVSHEENAPLENAAWTVTNPGGRDNPPTGNGIPSNGRFLVSDSDAANGGDTIGSGMSHDIWSPVINCSGKSPVWLHMDVSAVLNNNGTVVFDIDVTADGGTTWDNLFRRVAPARSADPLPLADIPDGLPGGPQVGNADAFYGRLDLDLSTFAANEPNVRFRLRQFEPNDDWWIAVDNVLVDTSPAIGGSRVVLGPEAFDGGIPGDWEVDSADGVATWDALDPCNASLLHLNGGLFPDGADGRQIHHLDSEFALVFQDATCSIVSGDETLKTPVLDLSGTTAVTLQFKSAILATDSTAEVVLSTDGGATFDAANPIFSYNLGGLLLRDSGNAEQIYNEYLFRVPGAVGQSRVVFAFRYLNGLQRRTAGWAVDDVLVTVEGGGGGQPMLHRGDADDNGELQLTDAIRILGFLFLGNQAPSCLDAADADDNGELQLTDAIRVLGFLFLGNAPPAPPGPPGSECGPDPGDVHLGCESYQNC